MIKIENLVHKYTIWKDENIKSEKTVLDGISLDIPSGQFVAILGPNGSGKSTLAKHLNVLLLPNEGTVWIDGKDTHAKERLWEIRSQVGMVFQNPDNQIIGTSVEEDVAFGPENKNIEPEKIRKIVETVLRKVKLWDRRKASPSILSGGQKQRLATADALAGLPACLVLDEPTAMLDPDSRKEVINIVKELNRKEGMTIILITHHTDEVVDADRIVLMKDGKIIGDDIPKKIFADYELLKKAKMDIDFEVPTFARLIIAIPLACSKKLKKTKKSGTLDVVTSSLNTIESGMNFENTVLLGKGAASVIQKIPDLGSNALELVDKTAELFEKSYEKNVNSEDANKILNKLGKRLNDYNKEVEEYKINKERKLLATKRPKAPPYIIASGVFDRIKDGMDYSKEGVEIFEGFREIL